MTFFEWLAKQSKRNDPIGDLAQDTKDDPPPDRITTPEQFYDWVRMRHVWVAPEALQAITEAAAEWRKTPSKVSVSLKVRFEVMHRDEFTCQLCGRDVKDGVKLEIDHKVPRAKGGSNDPSNLWTLCFDCNRGKRDRTL